jgi:FKBP-type peptidyl-prolyl cis-trans isomerase FkpA
MKKIKLVLGLLIIIFISSCTESINQQAVEDEKLIKDYLQRNNLKAEKTSSGMYYLFVKENPNGSPANRGRTAYVKYEGRFLDEEVFDYYPKPEDIEFGTTSFKFVIGQGQVIRGWDEALPLMKREERIRIFLPSHLGYGRFGSPPKIPGNTVLQFDIHLVNLE